MIFHRSTSWVRVGPVAAALLLLSPALAHDFRVTEVLLTLTDDERYVCDVKCDLDELLLGLPPGQDSARLAARIEALPTAERAERVDQLRRLIGKRVRIRFDDVADRPLVTFPYAGTPLSTHQGLPSALGVIARLEGTIPADAKEVTFWASRSFGAVKLTVFSASMTRAATFALTPGAESPPFDLSVPPGAAASQPSRTTADVIVDYLVAGFEHILPLGVDHILFVLGLFLLSTRLRPLLWQISAFTVAHSVTLGLAMVGIIRLSPAIVEPLIALSIAYVAIENVFTRRLTPWRPAVVFGLGLLHGMGFAGALEELGTPTGAFVAALASFNIGVELGQLAVVGLAFLTIGWLRDRSWYRSGVTIPLSVLIAGVALYWTVQRTLSYWG